VSRNADQLSLQLGGGETSVRKDRLRGVLRENKARSPTTRGEKKSRIEKKERCASNGLPCRGKNEDSQTEQHLTLNGENFFIGKK